MMSDTLVNLPDLLVSALKLLSAASLVFAVILAASISKRDWQSRYVWVVLGSCIVALVWLLNSALVLNARAIAFFYPYFFGFLFLLGPGIYFGLTNRKIQNLTFVLLHTSAAVIICISRWSVAKSDQISQEFIDNLIYLEKPLYSIFSKLFLHDDLILYALLPLHFLLYGLFTVFRTKKILHALVLALMLSLIMLFCYVYTGSSLGLNISVRVLTVTIEVALLFFILRYLVSGNNTEVSSDKSLTQRLEVRANEEIIDYLSDFERCQRDFSSSDFSVDTLIIKSNIDLYTWRNYLEDEQISFTTLKKRIRVNYAQRLLAKGFLDQYTVEYLTTTIGYQSRTSFYTAFKEVTGKSFAERDNAS